MGLLDKKNKKIIILFHPFTPKKGVSFFIPYKIEHWAYVGGTTEIWIPDSLKLSGEERLKGC